MADLALSRRAVVAGAAMTAFAGASAIAAPDADAALLDLGRKFTLAAARCDAASDAIDVAHSTFVTPEPPEPLFARLSDGIGLYSGATIRDGRRWYGDSIRAIATFPCGFSFDNEDGTIGWQSDPHALARRDEIVAAHEAWSGEVAAAWDAAGLTAAEDERAAASAEVRTLTAEIVAAPTASLAGLLVKARAAGWSYGGVDGVSAEIDAEPEGTGETVALAIVRDLLKVAERIAA